MILAKAPLPFPTFSSGRSKLKTPGGAAQTGLGLDYGDYNFVMGYVIGWWRFYGENMARLFGNVSIVALRNRRQESGIFSKNLIKIAGCIFSSVLALPLQKLEAVRETNSFLLKSQPVLAPPVGFFN